MTGWPIGPDPNPTRSQGWQSRERSLLVATLAVAFVAWLVRAVARGSYPGHVDEAHLSRHALQMLQAGDPSPHWFRYGSLPIYLTAAGMALGAWIGELQGTLKSIDDVWSVAPPYYSHPIVMLVPNVVFLTVGVIGLACATRLGSALAQRPFEVPWPALLLACSPLYSFQSSAYLNVDVVATALTLSALAHLCTTLGATDFRQRVLWPAVLCGATCATKYNSGLIVLPFAAAFALERRAREFVWFGVLTVVGFLAFEPFAAVEPHQFLFDLRHEIRHYGSGHPGAEGEAGLPQLVHYARVIVRDLGWPACACGAIAIVEGWRRNRRVMLLVLLFPTTMLVYMSTHRVNFPRSVLPAIAVLSVWMAIGLALGVGFLSTDGIGVLARRRLAPAVGERVERIWRVRAVRRVAALGLVVLVLGPPIRTAAMAALHPVRDSRVVIARWIAEHARRPCEVILPVQMRHVDPKSFERICKVRKLDLAHAADVKDFAAAAREDVERYVVFAPFREKGEGLVKRARFWREALATAAPREPVLRTGSGVYQLERRGRDVLDPKLEVYRLRPR